MNIGMVSTWFERGAAYVTKAYMELLQEEHDIFIYARGGEKFAKNDPNWDMSNVTWGLRLHGDSIYYSHIKKWINKNNLDVIFFNEQKDISVLHKIKKDLPHIKLGAYVDYYKEDTVKEFWMYDFLICNTKRHYSVFKDHPQCYYVPWGTDPTIFKPKVKENKNDLVFFHSAGMSVRKGTELVIEAFINGEVYRNARLIIHTQQRLNSKFGYSNEWLRKYNVDVIEETVSAPGLYYLGDVYVYPTKLEGLGLTLYESIASGLPVITTNHPPMNEVINNEVGYLTDVECLRSRADGYYWPLSIAKIDALIKGMEYFVNHRKNLESMKSKARDIALEKWNWEDRKKTVNDIFIETDVIVHKADPSLIANKGRADRLLDFIRNSPLYILFRKSSI